MGSQENRLEYKHCSGQAQRSGDTETKPVWGHQGRISEEIHLSWNPPGKHLVNEGKERWYLHQTKGIRWVKIWRGATLAFYLLQLLSMASKSLTVSALLASVCQLPSWPTLGPDSSHGATRGLLCTPSSLSRPAFTFSPCVCCALCLANCGCLPRSFPFSAHTLLRSQEVWLG